MHPVSGHTLSGAHAPSPGANTGTGGNRVQSPVPLPVSPYSSPGSHHRHDEHATSPPPHSLPLSLFLPSQRAM